MSRFGFNSASIGIVITCGTAVAQTQTTIRVSVSSVGVQGNAHSLYGIAISADGRFVAFPSRATNLVAGDTNNAWDVFVHDRIGGTTERVSVDSAGAQGNYDTYSQWGNAVSISADGRFVAFGSYASNLVMHDRNGNADIFVRDRTSGTTECVSIPTGGAAGGFGASTGITPSISADGRFVAFGSWAWRLVTGDTNGEADTFVRDRLLGTTERVSVTTGGVQANDDSGQFGNAISADGRFVAFVSVASNLVAGDTNNLGDVFVRDRQNGTTERVSVATGGVEGNSASGYPSLSADGRFVAFASYATNLVAGDTNATYDVFVRDRQNGTTERASVASNGAQGNSDSVGPSLSSDGRFVAFGSNASNLVAGDSNLHEDGFVRDRLLGTTEIVSVSTVGAQGDNHSGASAISADGRCVAFQSHATTLVAGDTNGASDIFVRDLAGQPVSYCTSGTSSNGCSASITASANPSASLTYTCNITVTSVEGQKSGILFYGINNAGYTPGPWAAGSTSYLCVKHPTQRTALQNSAGTLNLCDGSFVLDWNAYQATHPLALGNPWSIGDKVYAQAWFRDPLAVKSTNLSNALEMTYVP